MNVQHWSPMARTMRNTMLGRAAHWEEPAYSRDGDVQSLKWNRGGRALSVRVEPDTVTIFGETNETFRTSDERLFVAALDAWKWLEGTV